MYSHAQMAADVDKASRIREAIPLDAKWVSLLRADGPLTRIPLPIVEAMSTALLRLENDRVKFIDVETDDAFTNVKDSLSALCSAIEGHLDGGESSSYVAIPMVWKDQGKGERYYAAIAELSAHRRLFLDHFDALANLLARKGLMRQSVPSAQSTPTVFQQFNQYVGAGGTGTQGAKVDQNMLRDPKADSERPTKQSPTPGTEDSTADDIDETGTGAFFFCAFLAFLMFGGVSLAISGQPLSNGQPPGLVERITMGVLFACLGVAALASSFSYLTVALAQRTAGAAETTATNTLQGHRVAAALHAKTAATTALLARAVAATVVLVAALYSWLPFFGSHGRAVSERVHQARTEAVNQAAAARRVLTHASDERTAKG
ncbi:hypothetical protein ABZW30_18710 [Kitasatospora sp. NPDC004669]|uniref:hypothetical protein n=1 Tax=Kitasatospora sp. NPDC004669 TaxID=3154555 RepID=UPI00339E3BA6